MALVNYTLPFGNVQTSNWATVSPVHSQHASAVNNLLYGPAGHQEGDPNNREFSPYSPPLQQPQNSPQQQNSQYRQATRNNYLPPPQPYSQSPPKQQVYQQPQVHPQQPSRTYGEGSYSAGPSRTANQQQQSPSYYNPGGYNQQPLQPTSFNAPGQPPQNNYRNNVGSPQIPPPQSGFQATPPPNRVPPPPVSSGRGISSTSAGSALPERPPGFVKVNAGQGSRTQVHAVLDYDDDEEEYYDDADDGSPTGGRVPDNRKNSRMPTVTPIQGPIFLKNGTVPVVPLFAYPQVSNGTFVQIPIWWTALSVALGLNVRGDVIKGVPCVKKYHQLFCPTAGNTYPIDKIETFIDENKALMKRMYGDFEMTSRYSPPPQGGNKRKRHLQGSTDDHFTILPELMDLYGVPGSPDGPQEFASGRGDSYFGRLRNKRQSQSRGNGGGTTSGNGGSNGNGSGNRANGRQSSSESSGESTGRVDACESKIEIVTPYWASNSAGKVRAIVNTQHFEQAIHQEVCSKTQTSRCSGDCGCEQKYKWHRLLAYDPDNDCKGIFMDWFLFPSCCVCRCNP
ncbi:protein spaetzle 3 [Toxorhynchites rutilus septentrionalis]|uniref:protein spaetzle 3 n=1 Tax=Toxorhynchites rutilus septentrionalis TaxID=329112 RepID=UPI002478F0EE|nr:protein spaetzle 3 [Toxorhynchites rutilus septentrionalis]XP_055638970.1 protein spaetzle 3 [Toxorhynchites rutilus septentrionalis]XP_055638971.1 protein spaetzle 3 [Toxorhynchites rutilus septentrionalis]